MSSVADHGDSASAAWTEQRDRADRLQRLMDNDREAMRVIVAERDRLREQNDGLYAAAELLGAGQERLREALQKLATLDGLEPATVRHIAKEALDA